VAKSWKQLLEEERRKPNDTWREMMRRKFEKVARDWVEINEQLLQTEAEYRAKISERTKKGLQKARKKGKRLGRPRGTKVDVKKVRKLAKDGFTQLEIARALNISQTTVSTTLRKKRRAA
jgi:DNA-binding NarL/FixJ family response regulator